MPTLVHYQATFTDTAGNVRPGLSIEIRNESTGAIAAIYSDKDGNTAKNNPFTTDDFGYGDFYVAQGQYRIQADGLDWRHVPITSPEAVEAAVTEAETARDAAQLNAGIYDDTTAGLAGTSDGDYFSTPSADSNEYLILYRNDAGSATEIETYPSVAGIQATDISGNPVTTSTGAQTLAGALDQRVIYVDTIADLQALDTSALVDGQAIIVGSMFTGARQNQRTFIWRDGVAKTEHDGGRILSPTVPFAETESGIADFLAGTGETDSAGTGVFEEWKDHFSVMDYFAFRNGTDDDSISFRHLAAMADADRIRSIYIPNAEGTYFVKQTTVFSEPGVRIYGDAGPTYNRGTGKAGQITFDDDTFVSPIFDLGNFRTSGNPADQWTVEGLHFRRASGSGKQIDAILHTTQTNGPDRGILIDKCSADGMHSLFAVAAETVTNSLANVKITNCNVSNNEYGVYADGSVLGLEFTGNQAEQNAQGAIYGKFGSGITIRDNMLEGQPTPITIFPPDVGNRPKVSIKRNYFEANTGAHLISLRGTIQGCEAEIGGNFNVAGTYDDFCVIRGGGWRIQLTDRGTSITMAGGNVLFGSDIFPRGTDSYWIRESSQNGTEVQIEKHDQFVSRDRADYTVSSATGTDTIYTPYGEKTDGYKTTGSTKFFGLDVGSVEAGDIVVFSVLMRSEYNGTNNTHVQVFNNAQTTNLGQVSDPQAVESDALAGRWALVQYAVEMSGSAADNLNFRFFNFTGAAPVIEIAGIAARNYGAIPAGGKLEIFPITVI